MARTHCCVAQACLSSPRRVLQRTNTTSLTHRVAYRRAYSAAAATAASDTAAKRPLGRHALRVRAIGFELPGAEPAKSAEKAAEELCRSAASLLLYSSVLKGKPAQAFLGVLQLLQKGNPLSLVQQYGELYRLLAVDGYASWQDCLLDQVIKATDNPLARAAAAGKPTQHLHAAAAHDLDQLQQLAVTETTLATWVKDTAFGLSGEWLGAATRLAAAAPEQSPEPVHSALLAAAGPPPTLAAPLTAAQRAGLRAELASKWRWSEGVELLTRYYATHGCGLVSQHSVLVWTGKLQAQDVLKGAHELQAAEESGLVAPHHPAAETLVAVLTDFLGQDVSHTCSPPHVAVCGPATERWLYTAWALQRVGERTTDKEHVAAAAAGLRTLVVPHNQVAGLADLAWSLSQHPRTRFAVCINAGLDSHNGSPAVADAAAMLSGYDGFSWPANALLIAGFPAAPPPDLVPVFGDRIAKTGEREQA